MTAIPRGRGRGILAGAILLVLMVLAFASTVMRSPDAHAADNETDKCYVTSAVVTDKIDGLTPFDADDDPGNDSGATNDIVRSFDNVNYTLEYVTAIKGNETVDETKLMVEFRLPFGKDVAQFDMATMQWMQNPVLTTEADGSQVLTGYRLLQNTEGAIMVPGAGTLSVGIAVKAADNGTVITPSFKLWMEGNSEAEHLAVSGAAHNLSTTVSSFPKVNVRIQRNGYMKKLAWFDFDTGQESEDETGVYGRMMGYGISLELRGDNASKGMKGVALPKGDIEFDIVMREAANELGIGLDAEPDSRFTPMFWDYNPVVSSTVTGKNGRNMFWDYNTLTRIPTHCCPYSTGGNHESCYDSGTWNIVDNGDGTLHVTVSGYRFDTDNWSFPTNTNSSASQAYDPSYVGHFSTQHIQVLCSEPQTVETITNAYIATHVTNLHVTSNTGQESGDRIATDNSATALVVLYPTGSFSKSISVICGSTGRSSTWQNSYGDAYNFAGQDITAQNYIFRDGDNRTGSLDYLFKFDTDGLELRPNTQPSSITFAPTVATSVLGTLKNMFAAKPDGQPWADDAEIIATKQEDLVYYDTLEELEATGATCVGVLSELRDADLYHSWTCGYVYVPLRTKDDAEAGEVYIMASDARAWNSDTENDFTMDGLTYPYERDENNRYLAGYPRPDATDTCDGYTKTQYDESGNIVGGHTGGWNRGNSILIIGYRAYISKKVADLDSAGRPKTSYDMDANERTVTFRLSPSLAASVPEGTDKRTTLYVADTLPHELIYDDGSSYWGNMPIVPIVTPDGTGTKLEYTLPDVVIGATVEPITFTCTIGRAGTSDDVYNNQIITNTATIRGDEDKRKIEAANNNLSTASFAVIKLSAISLSKSTDTPYVRIGEDFRYSFKFANTSEGVISNTTLYDVLPFVGDGRNSDFGGTYALNSVILDFSEAPLTFADYQAGSYTFRATDSADAKSSTFAGIDAFAGWGEPLTRTFDAENKRVTVTGFPSDITALRMDLSIFGNESLTATLMMKGLGAQREGDVYVNSVYETAPGQPKEVTSNQAAVQIYGSIRLTKSWNDGNDAQSSRPDSIELHLLQNGHVYRVATLLKTQTEVLLEDIPFYDTQGNMYEYSAEEVPVPGYATTVTGSRDSGFSVSNVATRTTIRKVSSDGPTRPVVGARLQVLEGTDVIRDWTTTATSQEFEAIGLVVGTQYVLHEESAPDGFDVAADIPFTIDGEGYVTYGGSAHADLTMTDTYHAGGTVPLSATKQLLGHTLGDGEFSFELRDADNGVASSGSNDAAGIVTLTPLSYDETDIGQTYIYILSEVEGDEEFVDYDTTRYRLTVTVSDVGNGTLAFNTAWARETVADGGATSWVVLGTGEIPSFTNHYRVDMPVTGKMGRMRFLLAYATALLVTGWFLVACERLGGNA